MSYRDGPFNDLKVPLTWTAAVTVVVAIVAGIVMVATDRRETLQSEAYGVSRRMFDVADGPVAGVLSTPGVWVRQIGANIGGYFFAVSENQRLKQRIKDLEQWRDTAIALQDANARYQAILGLKTDPPIPMVTGRVVMDSRGPFANTRLANVGEEKGVKVGNPVMNERGLVGRIVGTTRGLSRVLLLTDVASRTPVLVDRTDARAILLGDGGGNPRLGFMRGVDPVREGDRILTSGDGGVFPRGLPVGVAAKGLDGQWRVRLYADLTAIDFIRVLEFEDFTAGINEKALEGGAMPPVPASLLARDAAQAEAAKLVIPQAKDAAGKPGAAAAKPGATAKPADGDAKATALKAKDSAGKAAPPKDPQARDAEPKGAPSRGARPGDAKAAAPAKAADAARSGGLAEELKARIKALTGGADKPAAEPRPKTEARAKTDARAEARPKAEARPLKEAAAP